MRRASRVAGVVLLAVAGAVLQAQTPAHLPIDHELAPGVDAFPLWANANLEAADTPSLTVFRPQGTGNGTAVIVAPGGGYTTLVTNLEGRQMADWFAAHGVTAFVLRYRLGAGHPYPEPLLDAQRAIRLVRARAAEFRVDPQRIGIIGFSAGGHLAAMTATAFHENGVEGGDGIDRVSDRPDFVVLAYAWLNAMQPNTQGRITYCSVLPSLPREKCPVWEKEYTPALHVSARTPSTFIYCTTDDQTVPVMGNVDFYSALVKTGVPAEMHLFRHGAHGSGLGSGDAALDHWPMLLEEWMRAQGWMPTPTR